MNAGSERRKKRRPLVYVIPASRGPPKGAEGANGGGQGGGRRQEGEGSEAILGNPWGGGAEFLRLGSAFSKSFTYPSRVTEAIRPEDIRHSRYRYAVCEEESPAKRKKRSVEKEKANIEEICRELWSRTDR
jgi:hypothetical protein